MNIETFFAIFGTLAKHCLVSLGNCFVIVGISGIFVLHVLDMPLTLFADIFYIRLKFFGDHGRLGGALGLIKGNFWKKKTDC